ncbi:hypothetical protein LHYA1_G007739 [Lachnellula hyalina]|uniref:GPI anchored serine-rich protein n=1 Tax=Lachnellula hyalina TaxID=1316788 RepID=A0A8H8TYG8_9HELO|nr:uncharacterized protein LHYA1_G007739 [Lachnellula hyalina]TVY23906.1 hypothetical protein LHYA1_G007739 [Lachnellula hyalina]
MKASIITLALSAALATAQNTTVPYTTSTLTQTKYLDLALPQSPTAARIGQVTTEISVTTTYCPVTGASSTPIVLSPPVTAASSASTPLTTSTKIKTKTYTISKCAATVTNCPYGSTTTSTYATVVTSPVSSAATGSVTGGASVPATGSVTGGASVPAKSASSVVVSVPVTTLSPPVSTAPASAPATLPVTSVVTISTCVPTVITSVVTVYPSSAPATTVVSSVKSYGTAAPSAPVTYSPSTNTTIVPFTGAASAQKAGGLLMAVGLAAFLL